MKQVISSLLLLISAVSVILFTRCDTTITETNQKKKSCCMKKDTLLESEITCPKCGHKKMEAMPTDVCVIRYTCEKCKTDLYAKEGDCCVFCSYGLVKCPSKQSPATPTHKWGEKNWWKNYFFFFLSFLSETKYRLDNTFINSKKEIDFPKLFYLRFTETQSELLH